ncbi:ABC transporter ATP-binding protein [Infirmifilum sp. NZ]|uniref:ABC transporter ATP-binding protein n=1 Tax=Infirmifilum sp. NZ TaxID=2926850 RepID=UPI0027A6CFDE|nr:ABC transporter ATP-binding protein [Infirmifilum sp. NZ]UNQ73811.1 ABC transporter ATP-binding protein [Infirmifilum sp. NZ]
MKLLYLEGVTKRYGNVTAVNNVTLEIEKGKLVSILGPSGCGKTTTLRIIAGLTTPDSGRVYLEDRDITFLPPEKREMGMVFQNYALWPHMTVYENVAFPLRARGLSKDEIERRVREYLELVRLYELRDRYPYQLSGGQQQRVALARALAVNPKVLLLDEPLSNLDAKLRDEMRVELREIQRKLGITAVYVTHDQVEALALSDYIALMKDGKVVQFGTPKEVFFNPADEFVASFLGRTNLVPAKVERVDPEGKLVLVRVGDALLKAPLRQSPTSGTVLLAVRASFAELLPAGSPVADNVLEATVRTVLFTGEKYEYSVELDTGNVIRVESTSEYPQGERVKIRIPFEKLVYIPVS